VQFKDGAAVLGTVAVDGSGVATFPTNALTATGSPPSLNRLPKL